MGLLHRIAARVDAAANMASLLRIIAFVLAGMVLLPLMALAVVGVLYLWEAWLWMGIIGPLIGADGLLAFDLGMGVLAAIVLGGVVGFHLASDAE